MAERQTKLPKDVTVHRQGYRDPIDGTLRLAVTACGLQLSPGTWVTDTEKQLNCDNCKQAKK